MIRLLSVALAVSISSIASAAPCQEARSVASEASGHARAATVTARDVGNLTVAKVVEAYIEQGMDHLDTDPSSSEMWFQAASSLSLHIHNPYALDVSTWTARAADSAAVCAVSRSVSSS